MSQSIPTSPQLHDIPLSGNEQGDADKQKNAISKTNSLKRFFKLPHKKTGDQMLPTTSVALLETAKEDLDENALNAAISNETPKDPKRFHLRLGLGKYDATHVPTAPLPTNSSKSTLKGSISSYFNTVFKRSGGKKNANAADENDAETNDEDADADEEVIETELREEVHNLPISDDCIEDMPSKD